MAAATITGGVKLEAYLRAVTAKLEAGGTFEVGFMSRATEADGTAVVEVATVNEFGGTASVPAHETIVYRKLGREGELLRGGRFVKAEQSNFATTHTVPAYTVTIPPRPFFRSMVAKESLLWGGDLGKVLVAVNYDADRALDLMGEEINGELIESMRNFTDPPNAPSTVAKKGVDNPLVDSGTTLRSTSCGSILVWPESSP